MQAIYVDHETGVVYETKDEAMEMYRQGHQIDLYAYSAVVDEIILRGSWEH